ncbi:MAG: NDP-sugar synthase [Desulfarculaceae bacterium]|nr:NDP-sugar synthase [Desulfarculaceae bacterium]MCF8048459.1 NDP-sugar synthase [Desulfarculaceae bacterium]MCF8096943.1 NDP-sugar synthase [Desulfarculaceae bacterium]MCF8122637.1 NDP-sugar synthase [Desulfarculaceae bacterium]
MRAMILAAGYGTRLRPLTDKRPKCLMPVMNRPLLGLWMGRLQSWGVERVVVNTHHLADMVQAYFREQPPSEMEVAVSHEPTILGTGGGPLAARELLGDKPFLLVNADVLATAQIPALLRHLEAEDAVAMLGLVDEPRFNTVALDEAGRVLGFKNQEGLSAPRWLTYSGLAALSPRLFDYLPLAGYSTLVDGLKAAIAAGETVLGQPLEGFWDDLGTPERLIMLHRRLAQNPPEGLMGLSPEGPVLLGPGARLENGAQVKGFAVLGQGAVAGAGSFLNDVVLLPGARVAAGAVVEQAVLGDGYIASGRIKGGAYA